MTAPAYPARSPLAAPRPTTFTSVELDGEGSARIESAVEPEAWRRSPAPLWAIVSAASPAARRWLEEEIGLSAAEYGPLLGEPRRAWATIEGDRLLAAFESLPGDGAPGWIRILRMPNRLITIGDEGLPVIAAALSRLKEGQGARTIPELVAGLAAIAAERVATRAFRLEADTTDVEVRLDGDDVPPRLQDLRALQTEAGLLRRQITCHREALGRLDALDGGRTMGTETERWRRLLHELDDLADLVDGVGERLRAVEGYVRNRLSSVVADRVYLLTLITTIVLPLSFVTGLLGVNVGGLPLRQTGWAFAGLCGVLALFAIAEFFLIRRLRWVPRRRGAGPFDPTQRDGARALRATDTVLSGSLAGSISPSPTPAASAAPLPAPSD